MLPSGIMSVKKHWVLVGCCLRDTCQSRNSDDIETLTMIFPLGITSGIMSAKKHWLQVGCYPCRSCQWGNTNNWSDVSPRSHVSDEILTICRILPFEKRWLLIGWYPRKSWQWCSTDCWSDVTLGNNFSEETTGRMLHSWIMSVKKHSLRVV